MPPAALEAIFGSAARVAVLRVFVLDPTRRYYQRQLEAATGVAVRGIQRELDRLVSIDLLYRHKEGNRAYYQIDMDYPLFSELRSMILKTAEPHEQLRADLSIDSTVRLAFLRKDGKQVLVVAAPGAEPNFAKHEDFQFTIMKSNEFLRQLDEDAALAGFLRDGEDILGRRDDVIWRRIEAAGYDVKKGRGVP